ncbi:EAL domain, c-di-GMP-specific phosphodiesterase class I (or its enzymatically inactive variant) [Bosea sp. TND4EK4]|nr:EAL domain, c-di-GMP-specific phosphodiesterase class I (or its enzymatically inactive variant) [Bosea sp. TND4EK4]
MFGVFLGLFWLSIFVVSQHWTAAIGLATLGILAIPCWLIGRSGKFSLGLMLAQIVCLTYIVFFALVFDIPTTAIPRTTHLYLLVIAVVGFINYRREPLLLQVPIIVACLVAFIAIAAVNPSVAIAIPMSESVRSAGAWINASVSICMLGACIVAMQIDLSRSTDIASELQKALWKRQFRLVYQPQVDAEGKVLGAEVLLRWTHPKRGEVPPAEFIPLAEQVGFMPQLGTWIITEACRTLADWRADESRRALTLSINVTADQFIQPDFYAALRQAVDRSEIAPDRLKLELTETVFVNDVDAIVTKLLLLRHAGFAISLDDFGTGYSSLSYLRQLPLNQIKVDRSFVRGVAESRRAAALAKTIVQIGHDLGLDVLAEGIETEEQHRIMQAYGCTGFQGFHFGRPMPLPAFEQWLAEAQRPAPQARVPAMA